MGYIYIIKNINNNKIYVGKTIQNIDRRLNKHQYDAKNGSNIYFHRAIRKYKNKDFKTYYIKIDDEFNFILNEFEKNIIKICNSKSPNGYNLTDGGEGLPGISVYEIWIKKYGKEKADILNKECNDKKRIKNSGKNNPMYGKYYYNIWVEKYGKNKADEMLNKKNENLKNKFSGYNNSYFVKIIKPIWDKYENKIIHLLVDEKIKKTKVLELLGLKGKIRRWIKYYVWKGSLIENRLGHRTFVYKRNTPK